MEGNVTNIGWQALIMLVAACVMILVLPRRVAIAPLIAMVVLMTLGQQFVILGLHFTLIRVLILTSWVRILIRREYEGFQNSDIDKAFLYYVSAIVLIGIIPRPPHPDAVMRHTFMSVLINKSGFFYDAVGSYFLSRCFVKDSDDVIYAIKFTILIGVILSCFMAVEKSTGRNIFSVFGVVPEITMIRDGRLRCQGPFSHPIHAGNFGATLVPLSLGLWFRGDRKAGALGAVAGTFITVASSSSGPLMAYVYGNLAWVFWRFRDKMRQVRWAMVALLISLEFYMKAHVWWVIARMGDIIGGGGYWRSKLIDQFVGHIDEWWLIGTRYTAHWSPTGMGLPDYPDMMDITNKFVSDGVSGGLLGLILFIVVLVRSFKQVGRIVQDSTKYNLNERLLFWALGCTLVTYILAFMSVSSSAQTGVLFYLLLAFIGCAPKETDNSESGLKGTSTDLSLQQGTC